MNIQKRCIATFVGISLAAISLSSAFAATTAKVSSSGVNLRTKPNVDSEILAVLPQGETVTIISSEGSWYSVSYKDKKGYIREDLLAFNNGTGSASTSAKKNATVNRDTVNMRSEPSIDSQVVKLLDEGNSVKILDELDSWFHISSGSENGYVRKDMLAVGDKPKADATIYIPEEKTSSVETKEKATVKKVEETFEKKTTISEKSQEKRSQSSESTATSNETNVHAQKLLSGLKFYSGKQDGSMGKVTIAAIKSFQRAYSLDINGKLNGTTIAAIENASQTGGNGKSAGKVKEKNNVILAEWFNYMQEAFPYKVPVRIVDVETGTEFHLRAFSKGYHADVETPTKEDTEILYKINGNKWAWTPRAVWVYFDGKIYAAAINVQPHGPDTLPDNGMTGQICLHFLHSRQHNTGQENKNLQAAVLKAFENADKAPGAIASSKKMYETAEIVSGSTWSGLENIDDEEPISNEDIETEKIPLDEVEDI